MMVVGGEFRIYQMEKPENVKKVQNIPSKRGMPHFCVNEQPTFLESNQGPHVQGT